MKKAEETLGPREETLLARNNTQLPPSSSFQKSNLNTFKTDDQRKITISTTKAAKIQSNFLKALLKKDELAPPFTETVVTLNELVSGVYRIIVVWLILVIGGVGAAEVIEI